MLPRANLCLEARLFIFYSVVCTGTLWLAIGLYAAFDYMQFFVIGTPNGTMCPLVGCSMSPSKEQRG